MRRREEEQRLASSVVASVIARQHENNRLGKKGQVSKLLKLRNKLRTRRSKTGNNFTMDAIRSLYFFSHVNRVKTDSVVLRLHGLTAAILLTFSITVTTRQAVGNPIDCVHTREIPVEVFNAYCWVHSTYFVTAAMLGLTGINVAFPGVGPSGYHGQRRHDNGVTKQVKYYQWVAFMLFFQSPLSVLQRLLLDIVCIA